jgi:hypothetical protein
MGKKRMPPAPATADKSKARQPAEAAGRQGRNFNFWANPELAHALDSFMESLPYDTTYKTHLELALQAYLREQGFWPPGS